MRLHDVVCMLDNPDQARTTSPRILLVRLLHQAGEHLAARDSLTQVLLADPGNLAAIGLPALIATEPGDTTASQYARSLHASTDNRASYRLARFAAANADAEESARRMAEAHVRGMPHSVRTRWFPERAALSACKTTSPAARSMFAENGPGEVCR